MKEKNDDDKIEVTPTKAMWILLVVLAIAAIFHSVQISNLQEGNALTEARFKEALAQRSALQKWHNDLSDDYYQTKERDIESIKMNTAQLWYASLENKELDGFDTWFKDNFNFDKNCSQPINLRIDNSFFAYSGSPADYMIVEYEEGFQVFNKDGSINCYAFPIESNKPKPIACKDMCDIQTQAEKEDEEVKADEFE